MAPVAVQVPHWKKQGGPVVGMMSISTAEGGAASAVDAPTPASKATTAMSAATMRVFIILPPSPDG